MPRRFNLLLSLVLALGSLPLRTGDLASAEARPPVLRKALAGPMKDVEEIVFCSRTRYDDGHWYANIGYYCDDEQHKAYPGNGQPDVSGLYRLDIRSGEIATLVDAKGGTVRDPQVHYDAKKILFSYRKAGVEVFHLYEIHLDGSGLRQITHGDRDDYEPTYLPDGDILFVSTRCNRWVNCWMTQVGILYRCGPDGSDIRPVSANTEHDNTPWVLPDGRILYTRWEYVDRSQVEFHHLWVMNPDGTGQTVYYGNLHPHILMIDAKPIPGSNKIIASFSPGHGANEHAGIATVVSTDAGPDEQASARRLHPGPLTRDPYALSEDCFIMARNRQILLMDGEGKTAVIYTYSGPGEVHEPRPVVKRERERVFPAKSEERSPTGTMILTDVYRGRRLEGVQRGEIKKLLVLESLPKPVNFSGGPDLLSWLGTFTLERVLGVVPVAEDGSAHFEVPANRQVFFVALDDKDLAVKRMQSFTCAMPGEVLSCVGCHEQRTRTPENRFEGTPLALRHPPSKIEPFPGLPDVLDFHRDVQPVLDAHCIRCHGYERREGHVILEGDLGPNWSHSFFSLFAYQQVADGRNGLGNQPPRTIGSSASPLLQKIDGSHHDVRVSPEEWRTLWLWIESGAAYAGSYAGLRNAEEQARVNLAHAAVFQTAGEILHRRCRSCHAPGSALSLPNNGPEQQQRRQAAGRPTAAHERIVFENDPIARFGTNIILNFTRPEKSPLVLGPLSKEAGGFGSCGDVFRDTSDPDYRRLVAGIAVGKAKLDVEPRYATNEFRPNHQYIREMKRFGILPSAFDAKKDPIDVFEVDQEYWQSFWVSAPRSSGE